MTPALAELIERIEKRPSGSFGEMTLIAAIREREDALREMRAAGDALAEHVLGILNAEDE